MKNKIVVAEATSTAFNYLEDIRALLDANGDNLFDYLFIQTPYNENWESEHLFVVTFAYADGFADLTEDAWYYEAVTAVKAETAFFDGNLAFNAAETMTTADEIAVLESVLGETVTYETETATATRATTAGLFAAVAKALGVEAEAGENFADCLDSDNAADIAYLKAAGLVNGYPDGTFKPGNTITRAEFCQMVYNLLTLVDAE